MAAGQVIVDFNELRDTPATQARSTLITTSIQAIRARGRFATYEEGLPPPLRQSILTVVAGAWLPIELALAHYTACEGLGLPVAEQVAIGMEVEVQFEPTVGGYAVPVFRPRTG